MCYVMRWDASILSFHGPDYGCGSDPFGVEVLYLARVCLLSANLSPVARARSEAPSFLHRS